MNMNKISKTEVAADFKVLKTALGTVLGTATLVGMHHHYRKSQIPDARLQDYVLGLNTRLQTLRLSKPIQSKKDLSPVLQIMRLRYAYQQATTAYKNYAQSGTYNDSDAHKHNLTDQHTTVMLARSICWVSGLSSMPKPTDKAMSEDSGNNERCFGVVGIDSDRQIVWQTTMPERVHDIVVQPIIDNKIRHVIVMGRRPSERFWVLDTATGQVQYAIKAAADRHFYGHACYSLDGMQLYVTENDTVSLNGKIGIYDALNGYKKVAEFDSHGIGPHELIMHPDTNTLIIANGGIKTEQASREELNLDTMRPSLVYLNCHNGTLLEQIVPEHSQMSIRHLAMHDNGTVMIGIQFQGEKHINVPLVLTHKQGDTEFEPLIMPNNQWQRFHQYIASVAVDSKNNLLCVTTPIGGCAAIYDLTTRKLIDAVTLLDCAGASVIANPSQARFIVSDGLGNLTTLSVENLTIDVNDLSDKMLDKAIVVDSQQHLMAFDNHLQAL